MNRSLVSFLGFLGVLAVMFVFGVWWFGPKVVSLVLDTDLRTKPYYAVYLVAAGGEAQSSNHFARLAQLARDEDGQIVWRGVVVGSHMGRVSGAFKHAVIFEFPGGGRLVQMITSVAYRELAAQTKPVLLGTSTAPGPIAQDETLLLWLLASRGESSEVGLPALDASLETARGYTGQTVWSVAVDVLAGGRAWDRMILLAFAEPARARRWLEDAEVSTDRALLRRYFADPALLELRAGLAQRTP